MPRKYYDTNGSDVSSSVYSFLSSALVIDQVDLFWMRYFYSSYGSGANPYRDLFVSMGSFPVSVNVLPSGVDGQFSTVNALFTPGSMSRSKFDYGIGLTDNPVDIQWNLDDTTILPGYPGLSIKQALADNRLQETPIWILRAIFNGNPRLRGTLLGVTQMFRGWLRELKEVTIDHATLTVSSPLSVFHQVQTPTQLVQPGTRIPPYTAYQPNGGVLVSPDYGSSTPSDIHYPVTLFNSYADHALAGMYMSNDDHLSGHGTAPILITNGNPMPWFYRIQDNLTISGVLHIYPYFPIYPLTVQMIPLTYTHLYSDLALTNSAGVPPGFPSVPPPEIGI